MTHTIQYYKEKEASIAAMGVVDDISPIVRQHTHHIDSSYNEAFLIAAEHTLSSVAPQNRKFKADGDTARIKYFIPLNQCSIENGLHNVFDHHSLISRGTDQRVETRAYYVTPTNLIDVPEHSNLLFLTSDTKYNEDVVIQMWTQQHDLLAPKLKHS